MAEKDLSRYYHIIKKPLVTEKSTILQDEKNQYCFQVASKANKVEIREAVERIFDVKVVAVNTMRRKGKRRRMVGGIGMTNEIKRAIVTLREGDNIEII